MAKGKNKNKQKNNKKKTHRNIKIEQNEPHKTVVNSGTPEG